MDPKPLPDTLELALTQICASCKATVPLMSFRFPTSMFLPSGQLEHRLHRSEFIKIMAELYDRTANEAREKCNEMDPLTVRPPLEKLGLTIVSVPTVHEEPE